MDWWVTEGSLTTKDFYEIWDCVTPLLYNGTELGTYNCFCDNCEMCNPDLYDDHNEPDIYPPIPWSDDTVALKDQTISANTKIWLLLRIVVTEPGPYTFAVTGPPNIEITPSSWKINLADINGDGKVRIDDVGLAVEAFGNYVGHDRWNPAADLISDGKIRVNDILAIALNFGWTADDC